MNVRPIRAPPELAVLSEDAPHPRSRPDLSQAPDSVLVTSCSCFSSYPLSVFLLLQEHCLLTDEQIRLFGNNFIKAKLLIPKHQSVKLITIEEISF